jgi:hypothetical protein
MFAIVDRRAARPQAQEIGDQRSLRGYSHAFNIDVFEPP